MVSKSYCARTFLNSRIFIWSRRKSGESSTWKWQDKAGAKTGCADRTLSRAFSASSCTRSESILRWRLARQSLPMCSGPSVDWRAFSIRLISSVNNSFSPEIEKFSGGEDDRAMKNRLRIGKVDVAKDDSLFARAQRQVNLRFHAQARKLTTRIGIYKYQTIPTLWFVTSLCELFRIRKLVPIMRKKTSA